MDIHRRRAACSTRSLRSFKIVLDELDARECFFVEVELRECLASALVVPSVVFEVERGFRGCLFVRLGVDAERFFVLFVDDGA